MFGDESIYFRRQEKAVSYGVSVAIHYFDYPFQHQKSEKTLEAPIFLIASINKAWLLIQLAVMAREICLFTTAIGFAGNPRN